ncbi:MAG: MFS transporter [Alphaproteobacteria bacterium]|nr:MFS transporter [Alphaproteobacteria bacterium]
MPALLLTVFVDTVGFGMVLPLLPYFAERYQASPDVVTMLVATFTLAQFVFVPVWGALSDRMGRRPVILLTVAGTAAGYAATAFADALWMLFAARAFTGAMASVAVVQAYVADVTDAAHRARGMGRIGAAHGLGFVCGPAIGGMFAGADPVGPDVRLPFLIAAALSLVALVVAAICVRESTGTAARASAARRPRKGRIAALREALSRPRLGVLLALLAMTPFAFSGIESTFVMWSERALGWGPAQNGWLYTYMGLVAVLTQAVVVGRLAAWIGEARTIRVGAACIALGAAALLFADGYVVLCLAFGLIVFGTCVNNPSLNSLISQFADPDRRGALLGVAQSCSALARVIGPVWGGVLFVGLGRDWPFVSAVVVMAAMFALALRLRTGGDGKGEGR